MEIKKTAPSKQDYFFSVLYKIAGVVLALIYSVFYSRYLGTILKGNAAIISNYISLISAFTALGMDHAYPYYRKTDKNVFYTFINNMTSFYFIMTVVCLVLVFTLQININLKVAIAIVPIQSYIRHINYVVMIEVPKRRYISSIIIHIMDIVVIIAFFLFSKSTYERLIIILIITNFINLIISFVCLKADVKKLKFDLSNIIKYAKFGLLPMFTLILITLNYKADIFMLDTIFHIPKSEIGIYSVAIALAEKIWLIPDVLMNILMSRLIFGKGSEEIAKLTRMSLFVSLILMAILLVLGRPIISFVYGLEYVGAYEILAIMLIGVIGMIFFKMVYSYNVVNGKRMINFLFLGGAAIINIIGNYFLIPIGGIAAAAWSSVISYLICGICFLLYFCHIEKVKLHEMLIIQKSDFSSFKNLIKNIK